MLSTALLGEGLNRHVRLLRAGGQINSYPREDDDVSDVLYIFWAGSWVRYGKRPCVARRERVKFDRGKYGAVSHLPHILHSKRMEPKADLTCSADRSIPRVYTTYVPPYEPTEQSKSLFNLIWVRASHRSPNGTTMVV